jgi:hypothetical protein
MKMEMTVQQQIETIFLIIDEEEKIRLSKQQQIYDSW